MIDDDTLPLDDSGEPELPHERDRRLRKATEPVPRGIRNNNPLNIRRTSIPWIGKVGQPTDDDFEQFESMAFGLRAAMINLRTIARRLEKKGGITIAKVIAVWAPPHENDTAAYAERVAAAVWTGAAFNLNPDTSVDLAMFDLFDFISPVVHAMVEVECGAGWSLRIPADDYREAARMTGLDLT